MCAALIRIGYKDDLRVKKALEWLVKVQNKDGGWLCPYWKAHIRDTHSCFYGTICPLEAFSELPKQDWTEPMKQTVEKGAEWVLMHRFFRADHHGYKVIKQAWLKLGFPWFWGYNILRGLRSHETGLHSGRTPHRRRRSPHAKTPKRRHVAARNRARRQDAYKPRTKR